MTRLRTCNTVSWVIVIVFAAGATSPVLALAPKVEKVVPANGDENVDPHLQEIRITFNQDMTTGRNFSICGGGSQYPKIIGNPRWVGKRVMVMKVRLQPNHAYRFSINCSGATGFRSARGEPAKIHPVHFKTRAAGQGQTTEQQVTGAYQAAVAELKRAINENYSYCELRKVDWEQQFTKYASHMEKATSPMQFAQVAGKLLASAKDKHIWLTVGEETVAAYKGKLRPNCNSSVLAKTVPGWKQRSPVVYTGRFDDGIGYILIESWGKQHAEALEMAYEAVYDFADAKGVIIDVRPNSGGAEPLAQAFAGCFVDKPVVYAKHVYRTGAGPDSFGEVNERILHPNKRRPRYRGKIAVLMGPGNMSSCEAFLLMMKQVPNCTFVGERSYGSSGNPKPVDLGNGVTVYLPSWKALRPDGTCFEGEGIAPDTTVKTTKKDLRQNDPVLEAALRVLRK